eukprot:m.458704 g.458704  ORF g.458704 m.458704 type:complete len:73 (+) comp20337_c2_seq30:208-426(+)
MLSWPPSVVILELELSSVSTTRRRLVPCVDTVQQLENPPENVFTGCTGIEGQHTGGTLLEVEVFGCGCFILQ